MTVAKTTEGAAAAVAAAADQPFVAKVREYTETVLRPAAPAIDRDGVTREGIAALAALGLLNHTSSREFGGAELDRNADRRVHELIAGACFNTWLVWAQHASLSERILAARAAGTPLSPLAQRVLRGELLLGAGVSDVRRFPDRYVAARKSAGGWIFDGTVSWVSGWGLNSALTVAAVEPAGETVVTALVPVSDHLVSAGPLELGAVAGSRTARVRLDGVFVPGEDVLATESLERTRFLDQGNASDARAQHFGLAETVLRELEETEQPLAQRIAEVWRPRVAEIRATAYDLSDEARAHGGGPYRLDDRLAARVAANDALAVLTRGLLVARAGRGLATGDTAQLYARSALFLLVQGQTPEVRAAQLIRYAR
ncbi:acyl-CoA dehydrogenase family protein [Nocardia sp. alder85J]|uniref:acyl-CoA dehydrogenase family protein n=1 Tax=Nocardia sp. alder85J TaxID=2862949 RepID=UPI001CD6CF70|nr:acyl-CoA dehydrogenase family protein [Nocardia sp. alder85J]MCX4098550.1 acyl-CoA/acyl-ACP dehydrogenase [Nocardia sp. alder85J]